MKRLVDVKARWLGHKLRAELTVAVDQSLSVAQANGIALALQRELHAHLPPLETATVQFDTSGAQPVNVPSGAAGHHHAPEPFRVQCALASGSLEIVNTPAGERMRLTVPEHVEGLAAVVEIHRPGGKVETLPLLPSDTVRHRFESTVAPEEPHEFDAKLRLSSVHRQETLPFRMVEPEGHHH